MAHAQEEGAKALGTGGTGKESTWARAVFICACVVHSLQFLLCSDASTFNGGINRNLSPKPQPI